MISSLFLFGLAIYSMVGGSMLLSAAFGILVNSGDLKASTARQREEARDEIMHYVAVAKWALVWPLGACLRIWKAVQHTREVTYR